MGVVAGTVAFIAALVAAITDIRKFRVYNALTIPLLITGLVYRSATGGPEGLLDSLGGSAFGFGVLLVPYLMGLMGAGDVKLLAGLGAWLGLKYTVLVFVVSSLATGIYALILMVWRGNLRESWAIMRLIFYRLRVIGFHFAQDDLVESMMAKSDRRLRVIPFGASLPIGLIGAYVYLTWFR